MLRALSGRVHSVQSAVCIRTATATREVLDETRVTFRPLPEGLLAWYLDGGEWRERAGAYAIQGAGAALVERIEGSYADRRRPPRRRPRRGAGAWAWRPARGSPFRGRLELRPVTGSIVCRRASSVADILQPPCSSDEGGR